MRQPWWRRWFRRRPSVERVARSTFRQSLSWRSRIFRGLCLLLALVAALGLLRFVGRDPLGWARHRIDDLRNTLVEVRGLTATVDPPTATDPKFPPAAAVDSRIDTAWVGSWGNETVGTTSAGTCNPSPSAGTALLVTAPAEVTVRALRVRAGLPAADTGRPLQWRPRVLEVRFSGGRCQQVQLKDTPDAQIVTISPVTTNAVRVSIVGVYPPPATDGVTQVAITEMGLLSRPR